MNDFLEKLQSYLFYIVQVRIYNRLLIFAHGIKINARSPIELQSIINLPVNNDLQTEEDFEPVLGTYELRGRRVEKNFQANTMQYRKIENCLMKMATRGT